MNEIKRIRQYDNYISIERNGGKTSIQSPGFESREVIDFMEFCEEKGRVYRLGQSTVYEIDPNFHTL